MPSNLNHTLLLSLLFITGLLSGCTSTLGEQYQNLNVSQTKQAKAWELQGKIAVKSPTDKFSTNLYWFHIGEENQLNLTTVLGTTVLKLSSTPGIARLEVDGKEYVDSNPQDLLEAVSGWSIPLDNLPLWITGQVGANDKISAYHDDGLIKTLISPAPEHNWQVSFLSWQQQSGASVPKLIKIERAGVQVRIQINRWQALKSQ
ncbi:lipoprotein insertase outer membrane protein LolB [Shewanella sp. SR44-3]|uniref:lipoprotein insertase outer membrane protein LolB n=2 Tax=Shewanella TaxID=22 RepID=UPI0015F7FDE4|nr:lipoprotein insertase outer membrane protein LolB [Shewanella sp. SR44-3]MBB1269512.1 outer membrane lipoprotein LolB [Shewanella sp. SR44-3]